jgi:isoaspartyl peptidase/L-asparaginase-like protein (Ntn-hydrolase superfamily)
MVAVDARGSVAAGSSSNGAIHKVPGRVGDAAVPGGGAYADSEVGGCGATGGARSGACNNAALESVGWWRPALKQCFA